MMMMRVAAQSVSAPSEAPEARPCLPRAEPPFTQIRLRGAIADRLTTVPVARQPRKNFLAFPHHHNVDIQFLQRARGVVEACGPTTTRVAAHIAKRLHPSLCGTRSSGGAHLQNK